MKDAKPFYELKKISTDEIKSGMNVRLTDETLIEVCFEIDGVFKSVKFVYEDESVSHMYIKQSDRIIHSYNFSSNDYKKYLKEYLEKMQKKISGEDVDITEPIVKLHNIASEGEPQLGVIYFPSEFWKIYE